MAAGLPVVIPSPEESFSEGLEKIAMFTKNNEKSFTDNIQKLLNNEDLRKKYSNQSLAKSKEFDSEKIEVEWFNCINKAKDWKINHLP